MKTPLHLRSPYVFSPSLLCDLSGLCVRLFLKDLLSMTAKSGFYRPTLNRTAVLGPHQHQQQ